LVWGWRTGQQIPVKLGKKRKSRCGGKRRGDPKRKEFHVIWGNRGTRGERTFPPPNPSNATGERRREWGLDTRGRSSGQHVFLETWGGKPNRGRNKVPYRANRRGEKRGDKVGQGGGGLALGEPTLKRRHTSLCFGRG